jgi:hypothetical protein
MLIVGGDGARRGEGCFEIKRNVPRTYLSGRRSERIKDTNRKRGKDGLGSVRRVFPLENAFKVMAKENSAWRIKREL